jgi:hypothetical protein
MTIGTYRDRDAATRVSAHREAADQVLFKEDGVIVLVGLPTNCPGIRRGRNGGSFSCRRHPVNITA